MGEMRVPNSQGDMKVEWDENSDREVREAERIFNDKLEKGWAAFRQTKIGKKGDQMRTFDRTAERILLLPPVAGG